MPGTRRDTLAPAAERRPPWRLILNFILLFAVHPIVLVCAIALVVWLLTYYAF